jgi:hypothetical protein
VQFEKDGHVEVRINGAKVESIYFTSGIRISFSVSDFYPLIMTNLLNDLKNL